ncbi:MAG: hypothetical protein KGI27_13810, partial [Thaumarchaeota archaeon]|nr:hypothetical protein [Nitrososphaerota archaeon]
MAYTYASNLNGTYETILESVQQIFSADADLFTGFSSNPSYLFADNLRQTMHNYAEFLEGALWLYGAVIVGNDLSEIEAVSLPLSTQDANYLSTRTNGFDTAINYLTTNLKMQPAPLANLTTSGPLIGDPGFETYFSQLNAEVAPSNLLSVQGGTLTDFANAPLSGATLTWVSPNFGTLPFGTGNGIAQVFQLPPEFTFPSIVPVAGVYKSDWQGNQLQYSTPRTNLQIDSNTFTPWLNSIGGTGTVPVVTANYATGPDGVSGSASRLQLNQGSGTTGSDYCFLTSPLTASLANEPYTESIWIKSNTGSSQPITITFSGALNQTFTIGTAWQRIYNSQTPTFSGANIYIGQEGDVSHAVTGDFLIAFSQLEFGSNATSVIVTTTSPGTVTDYSLSGSTLTFSIAPISKSSLTWQDASSNIFNFGVGNGSTTVYNLGVEYNPGPSIYKSDWQGNQLQYATPRTNLQTNSNTFTVWTNSIGGTGTAPVVTANYATGPDGVSGSASRLQLNQGSGTTDSDYCFLDSPAITSAANVQLVQSIWIKSNTGSSQPITLAFSGALKQTYTIGTAWQRIVNTQTPTFANADIYIGQEGDVSHAVTGDFQIAFSQFESGNVDTSYIPTTTAPVTVTDYSLESSLGAYGVSQDETNGWTRIRAALFVSGASYPPNLADTLTFMQNIQQKVTNYGVTYAPTLSNNFPVSAIWNYAICVWTYQDMAAIYSNFPDSQVIQNIQILRYVLKQVELQCAELLTAYRTQAQIPPNTSPLLQSDSLMDLANRALGDYTQWVNIATANGLLPPYTYPTPAPNIASPGTQLFMPGSSTPTNLGNYLLNFLGT